ncbi:GntR family transcriptional regulator, partial [Mycobacterium sp. ITM-2017-0098]
DVRQGDGTYVRATSEVSGALRRLCGAELREVLEVRRALEVEGARLAAAHCTADDVAALRALLKRRDECLDTDGTDEFARADAEF